jgi:hypothetical protein
MKKKGRGEREIQRRRREKGKRERGRKLIEKVFIL